MKIDGYIWDYTRYRRCVGQYLGRKVEEGICLMNRQDVYDYLSQETGIAGADAFESWAKSKSPGPTEANLRALEQFFGVNLTCEHTDHNKEEEEMRYNQFVSEHIANIAHILKGFIHSDRVDHEDAFCEMIYEIETEYLFVPDSVESLIREYIERYLEPIIYQHEEMFGKPAKLEDFIQYLIKADLALDKIIRDYKPAMVY